MTTLGN